MAGTGRPAWAGDELSGRLLAITNARAMEMKGRAVRGWPHVDGDDLRTKGQLPPQALPPRD